MVDLHKTNKLFRAFSDRTRLRILNLLAQQELSVCKIIQILKLPQSKISRHLAYLRKTKLVKTKRNGQMIIYSLVEPKNDLHIALIQCLKNCFKENRILQADIKKTKKEMKK